MKQLELFELDDQLDNVIAWAKHVKKTRSFFDASTLASEATHVLDIISRSGDKWARSVRMGLQHSHAWCYPGLGGCGKLRVDHEDGKLCIERFK